MATPHVAIRDVWAHNVEREFAIVRSVVEKFPYIAMARASRTPSLLVADIVISEGPRQCLRFYDN